jgi:putative hydrolase of the HAD superfamily
MPVRPKKPSAIAAIGFDLDYTLWDPDECRGAGLRTLAQSLTAGSGLDPVLVRTALGRAMDRLTPQHPRLLGAVLEDLGIGDPRAEQELAARYRNSQPLRLYPGTLSALEWFKRAGFRLFLVADGPRQVVRHQVRVLGLGPWFEAMVFTDELPGHHPKPSPVPFAIAAARLGVAPARCLYVGDDPARDFEGARKLGMRTLGVATGPFARLAVAPHQEPDQRIGCLRELVACLAGKALVRAPRGGRS